MAQTLKQKIAEAEDRLARLREQSRRTENGQKIILGGMLIHAARKDDKIRAWLLAEAEKYITAYSVDRGHRFWRSWAPLEREHFGRCDFKHGWSRWVNFGGGAGVPVTA
ncbi:hypothetical protein HHS34_004455 [Acidithiobacillus montserratensis]|uniref:Uncharacterized protein n=1 Tax=Acidithiobacillus montserratensis TaxID=2729135 RepID=A0ACD5HKJ4_9PROT